LWSALSENFSGILIPEGGGSYLVRFEREANGSQVDRIVALPLANKPGVDFCGYWQRSRAAV
jgi:hypothetical protein